MVKGRSADAGGRRKSPDRAQRSSAEKKTREIDPLIKGEWTNFVGKIEEVKGKGAPKRKLSIGEGKSLTEEQLPFLKDHTLGDLVAVNVQRGDPIKLTFAENLGKAGTIDAELARHAYSIGNGQTFPPPVQDEVANIQAEGEKMISKELEKKALVSANDVGWREKHTHGESRVDFREMKDLKGNDAYVMTIDPDTAKDYDDALHARTVHVNGKDYVEVGVHIADVTHFVSALEGKPGHAMFNEALLRTLTAYFPTQAFTMLPRILSEKLCSLEPGVDRLALSTVFLIDPTTGKIDDNLTWYGEGVINSGHRFSYKKAEELRVADGVTEDDEIEIDDENKNAAQGKGTKLRLQEGLHLLEKYGLVLRKEREDRKSATFPPRDELDALESGGEVLARAKESFDTNLIVQDWMIRANEAFATLITRKHESSGGTFPTLLRYHEPPTLDELQEIAERFEAHAIIEEISEYRRTHPAGAEMPKTGDTEVPFANNIVGKLMELSLTYEFTEKKKQAMRDAVALQKERHALYDPDPERQEQVLQENFTAWTGINRDWLRQGIFSLFKKARFTTELGVHFGLSLFPYTNATSPIRRFADIIVHQLVKAALAGDTELPEVLRPESVKKITEHMNAREILIRDGSALAKRMWAADFLTSSIDSEMTVRVSNIVRRKEGNSRGPRVMVLQVPLRGGFRMGFDIPMTRIKNMPPDNADVNHLIGHDIIVKLLGTDVATGMLDLEFVSAPKAAMRERMGVVEAEFMKEYLEGKITRLEGQFESVLTSKDALDRGLKKLKASVNALTARTPPHVVETWAEALGVLELKIQRAAMSMGISPSDSLSGLAQARTGDPALGRPAMPAPAEPQQPPEILNPPAANPEDAAALAKRQRIQELEREIAELQRAAKLRKLEEIEREIALLKSRRRT